MTEKEIYQLRLACAAPFVAVASKYALDKDEVFALGEKMYKFVTKALGETTTQITSLSQKPEGRRSQSLKQTKK